MRNLKRALSLVLAMVMLLGMMMINTNAASNFADADQIVNKEAVEITAGMGLFAGSDGKFDPQGNVTRAQMATIIVKMLRGSDYNADVFKGAANPFTDTASFEGGWAEGYINACYQMGIVKGYGDGTFKPGNSVTTAEAVTMIINALGVDAGQGEWPLTVMAKASAMKLFGDLNPAPATNDALVRDQLAVITLEGLQYSDSGKSGYKVENVPFVFDNMSDALKAAGYDATKITEVVGDDTLANSVYNMNVATGFITDNQAVGADYTVVGDETFAIETGLDMIGHYVSIYYKNPAQGEYVEAYETYAVVDESTVVVVSEDLNSSKEYKAAFGRNYDLKTTEGGAQDVLVFDGEYNMGGTVTGYTAGTAAPKGTYIIYENKVVAFILPGTSIASQLLTITNFGGEKTYTLAGVENPIDEADITMYGGAQKNDYVTYTIAGGQYVVSPADPVKGTATKYSTNADGEITVTVGGTAYVLFPAENNDSGLDADPATLDLSATQYTFYLSQDNKILGWEAADGSSSSDVNVDNIMYALGTFAVESKAGNYGEKVKKYFLQGIDTKGEEAHALLAIEYDTNKDGVFGGEGDEATLGTVPVLGTAQREGFYLLSDPDDKDAKKEGIKDFARIGVKDERDEATGNLFYGYGRYNSSATDNIVWPSTYANNHVCTTACPAETQEGMATGTSNHAGDGDTNATNKTTRTFFLSETKFLMIDGVLGEELETAIGAPDFKWTLPTAGEALKHPMLYRLNDVGATEILLVVIRKDPDELNLTTDVIFIPDNTPIASAADGDLYAVYDALTGTKSEAILYGADGVSAPATGFWNYIVQDDGTWKQTTVLKDDQKVGHVNPELTELYFSGLFDGFTVAATFADGSSVPFITGSDTSAAYVVDLRTESQKSASGISTITSVEQLDNLAKAGKLISMYAYNSKKTAVGCIYVKDVINNPTGVLFITDPTTGAAITLDGAPASVAITSGGFFSGFARVESAQGLVYLVPVEGAKYRTNEVITGVADGVIYSEPAEGAGAEPLTVNVNSRTVFFDMTDCNIATLADLEAAVATKTLTMACVGENGGTATTVIIVGQGDSNIANGDVILLDSALTATTTPGQVTGEMITGVKEGEDYTIRYAEVVVPDMVDSAAIAGRPGYYVVNKALDGSVTLTFQYNYIPQIGDKFFFTTIMKAGDVAEAYVLGSATESDGTKVYVVPVSGAGNTQSAFHFAEMTDAENIKTYSNQTYANTTKYIFGVHDVLGEVNESAGTILVNQTTWGHIGATSAATCCPWRLDSSVPGYYSGACGNADGKRGSGSYSECKSEQAVSADLVIVDLRAAVVAGTETAVTEGKTTYEALNAIKALNEAQSAVINVYSEGGETVTFIALQDHAPA